MKLNLKKFSNKKIWQFFLIFIFFLCFTFLIILYFKVKEFDKALHSLKTFNKTIVFTNKCNFNSEENIGCLAYIDNIRNKKDFNYSKKLKKLNNLSINEFEKKYTIAFVNPDTKQIVNTMNFEFKKGDKFFVIKNPILYKNEKQKFFVTELVKNEKFLKGDNNLSIIYIFFYKNQKDHKHKNGYSMSYFYSNKDYSKSKVELPYKKGFQFIGGCNDKFKTLKGDLKCKRAKYLIKLVKQSEMGNEDNIW